MVAHPALADNAVGARGHVGTLDNPKRVERLVITQPGVYENFLVDSDWQGGNRVKIMADNVTLRHCEIRNATGNGVGVFGKNVVIENTRIHHLLNGSYDDQRDAHGVTGRWLNVTIRNCEIYYVTGDCMQFDPDRKSTGRVLIENCTLWTGPLPNDAHTFKRGQRPGENAFDSKTKPTGPRCELIMRNCLMYGWNQPAQIGNAAALNLKENIHATIENCLFRDNEIAFRLRGPTSRGGARVTINDCAVFDTQYGVRMEAKIENLKIHSLGFGKDVTQRFHHVDGPYPGFENHGEYTAESFANALRNGLR
ncbi:MAG: right-handed parallel beta-helix repeat-containing protein [Planctomycetota bacterium]|jgi:hypothetical protein